MVCAMLLCLDGRVFGVCGEDGEGKCQEIGLSFAGTALKGALGDNAKYVLAGSSQWHMCMSTACIALFRGTR